MLGNIANDTCCIIDKFIKTAKPLCPGVSTTHDLIDICNTELLINILRNAINNESTGAKRFPANLCGSHVLLEFPSPEVSEQNTLTLDVSDGLETFRIKLDKSRTHLIARSYELRKRLGLSLDTPLLTSDGKINLRASYLSGHDFSHHDLSDVDFSYSELISSIFKKTSLASTIFNGCRMNNAAFEETDLIDSKMSEAIMTGAKFIKVNFLRTDLSSSAFHGTLLLECNLEKSNLDCANFTQARLENTTCSDTLMFRTNMSLAKIIAVTFSGTNLHSLNTQRTFFDKIKLKNVDLLPQRFDEMVSHEIINFIHSGNRIINVTLINEASYETEEYFMEEVLPELLRIKNKMFESDISKYTHTLFVKLLDELIHQPAFENKHEISNTLNFLKMPFINLDNNITLTEEIIPAAIKYFEDNPEKVFSDNMFYCKVVKSVVEKGDETQLCRIAKLREITRKLSSNTGVGTYTLETGRS